MPNDIHNMRFETLQEDGNDRFIESVRQVEGGHSWGTLSRIALFSVPGDRFIHVQYRSGDRCPGGHFNDVNLLGQLDQPCLG